MQATKIRWLEKGSRNCDTLQTAVVCKLLDLGHAGLGHSELGQRDWDMRNWDSFYSVKMGKIVVCV